MRYIYDTLVFNIFTKFQLETFALFYSDICEAGQGYSVLSMDCVDCKIGEYNNRTGTNPHTCKLCPEGTTSLVSGNDMCNPTCKLLFL